MITVSSISVIESEICRWGQTPSTFALINRNWVEMITVSSISVIESEICRWGHTINIYIHLIDMCESLELIQNLLVAPLPKDLRQENVVWGEVGHFFFKLSGNHNK